MASTTNEEAIHHLKDPPTGTDTLGSAEEISKPVTLSELTEAFTICYDRHHEALTYGCTVCCLLLCDECYQTQRPIGDRCSTKDTGHRFELLGEFERLVGDRMIDQMSLTKNLVSSVLELKRILGVYTASNIQSLWIRSEKGLTALATTTEEETKPKNKTNSQKESRESLECEAIPSYLPLRAGAGCEEKEIRSVNCYGGDSVICVQKGEVQLRGSRRYASPVERVPISVCSDREYGYAIFGDNHIRKFNLGSGETIHKWPVPNNNPYHHQMAVINGKIYYCNVNNNEIIIFPASKESTLEESRMSLEILEKPCYITDNTKHQEGTVIVSGASGVGKFPIRHGFSQPAWFQRTEYARGICVDDKGLIYLAKCQPSMICMLSQRTGNFLMELIDVQLPDEMWEITITEELPNKLYVMFVVGRGGMYLWLTKYIRTNPGAVMHV